jgi:hypothetical protein
MALVRLAFALVLAAAALAADRPAAAQGCPAAATGDCLTPHAGPGCDDPDCCATVCELNPVCCEEIWDPSCADLADQACVGLCGASASDSCFVAHGTPSCDDAACCDAVCTVDPVCCSAVWDAQCVILAQLSCSPPQPVQCGLPGQGSCTSTHGSPGCSDAQCCGAVCALVPNCCIYGWDQLCVDVAESACGYCTLVCPTGGMQEAESCGARTNEACASGQSAASLALGQTLCGRLVGSGGSTTDRDTFQFTLTDGDGDGKVRIVMRFAAEGPAFAALVPATCPLNLGGAVFHLNSSGCAPYETAACVPPGAYRVFVAMGTFPTPTPTSTVDCVSPRWYQLKCTASDSGCAPACGQGSGPCFDAHLGPGCDNPACCEPACILDPACCTEQWDVDCARSAAVACGVPVPLNDVCEGALPVRSVQTVAFSTIRATADALALPASCNTGSGGEFGPDVWFRYNGERSGNIVVTTCGSATDMRIAVYDATCGSPTLVACNSSSPLCVPGNGARAQFQSACGREYLIRVGGENPTLSGSGTLTISGQGPICPAFCPADINRDGTVTGADLGLLLGNWNFFGTGDLNQDGTVNGADLGLLLGAWGTCP